MTEILPQPSARRRSRDAPDDPHIIRETARQNRQNITAANEEARRQAEWEREQRALDAQERRETRQRAEQERREERARKTAERDRRAKARKHRSDKLCAHAKAVGRRTIVVTPITAPMAVAWYGQIQFAMHALGWWLIFSIGFAAAWEGTTTYFWYLLHQARSIGDRGLIFRAAMWTSALGAGAMNYWHTTTNWHANPQAVTYGVMSVVGLIALELYELLCQRRRLKDQGRLPKALPKFGLARTVRYPRVVWTAYSLAIWSGIETTDQAWSAAVRELERKRTVKRTKAYADRNKDRTGFAFMPVPILVPQQINTGTGDARTEAPSADQSGTERNADRIGWTTLDTDRTAHADGPNTIRSRTSTPDRTRADDTVTRRTKTAKTRTNTRTGGGRKRAVTLSEIERHAAKRAAEMVHSTGQTITRRSIRDTGNLNCSNSRWPLVSAYLRAELPADWFPPERAAG